MSDLNEKAIEVLDSFLFEDVDNNNNFSEDDWGITWVGDNFILLHRNTSKLINLKVTIGVGDLSEDEIDEAARDQEWLYDRD